MRTNRTVLGILLTQFLNPNNINESHRPSLCHTLLYLQLNGDIDYDEWFQVNELIHKHRVVYFELMGLEIGPSKTVWWPLNQQKEREDYINWILTNDASVDNTY